MILCSRKGHPRRSIHACMLLDVRDKSRAEDLSNAGLDPLKKLRDIKKDVTFSLEFPGLF